MSEAARIDSRKDGAIGWLVFNNPARRNAVSVGMWEAIPRVLEDFGADPAIRVVVLAGAGEKAFVSGADISQFEAQRSTAEAVRRYEEIGDAAQVALQRFDKPTLAMIRGYCIGGGLGIAAAMLEDVRESLTAWFTTLKRPSFACSTSAAAWRCCTCGSANTWSTL